MKSLGIDGGAFKKKSKVCSKAHFEMTAKYCRNGRKAV